MNLNKKLTVDEAYSMLETVLAPEYKEALETLYSASKSQEQNKQYVSYKQFQFMKSLAIAGGSTLQEELAKRNIQTGEKPWQIDRQAGKNLIDEFISLGYRDQLPSRG